jgi:uncharacterized membrane protein
MSAIQESIAINCPAEKAFAYTTQVKGWPDWQTFIREAEQTSPGPWGIGTTSRGVSHMMGVSMKWTAEVTGNEPNRKWVKKIISGPMSFTERVTYDPVGPGIKFCISYDIKASGIMKLFSPMITSSMRKETVRSLGKLKNILEAQS